MAQQTKKNESRPKKNKRQAVTCVWKLQSLMVRVSQVDVVPTWNGQSLTVSVPPDTIPSLQTATYAVNAIYTEEESIDEEIEIEYPPASGGVKPVYKTYLNTQLSSQE